MSTAFDIPRDADTFEIKFGHKTFTLTNLKKFVWPQEKKTKRDLLIYYAALARTIIPHIQSRGLIVRKYLDTFTGEFVLLNKLKGCYPEWLKTAVFVRSSGGYIDLPMVQDLASLLWIVNSGCIDLYQSTVRCDDVQRPDYVIFDLDPVPSASFAQVREAALIIRESLLRRGLDAYAMVTGLRGIHLVMPIHRKPHSKDVWLVAKRFARALIQKHPGLLAPEYSSSKRVCGPVIVNCRRNMEGYTSSSPYSLRASPRATVCTPVLWEEMESDSCLPEFTIDTVPSRVEQMGDLFKPLLRPGSRYPLEALL